MRWGACPKLWPIVATKLGMTCVALGTIAAAEIANGAPPHEAAQPAENVAAARPVEDEPDQDFSLPPLSSFAEITRRPLFNDTRRPALAADLSGDAWSSFVLKGVVVSPITREALVAHNKPAALVSLREGEMLDGWVAESILSDRVVFRNGNAEQELTLAAARHSHEPASRMPAASPPAPLARPEPPSF